MLQRNTDQTDRFGHVIKSPGWVLLVSTSFQFDPVEKKKKKISTITAGNKWCQRINLNLN